MGALNSKVVRLYAPEEEVRSRGRRSEPGKGEIVDIMLLSPFDPTNPESGEKWQRGDGRTIIHFTRGEDFAECWAEIVVKVKPKVKKHELARCLLDLVQSLGGCG